MEEELQALKAEINDKQNLADWVDFVKMTEIAEILGETPFYIPLNLDTRGIS